MMSGTGPAQYRKKPAVVEAMQYRETFDGSLPLAEFCGPALCRIGEDHDLAIRTIEGDMRIRDGDWIIRGVRGEFYPCKPDIFAETYEPAEALS
jgi:hypothetical protein